MSLDSKKLTIGYIDQSNYLDKRIADIKKALDGINKQVEHRNLLEAKIESLEAQIADGEQRIDSIKEDWFDASFNEEWDTQNELQERRQNIKLEVEGLAQEKEAAETELADVVKNIPREEVGRLAADVENLSVPNDLEFLHQLKLAVQDKIVEQRAAIDGFRYREIPHEFMDEGAYYERLTELDERWSAERVGA